MATEDELPEELDKLEITTTLPQVKLLDSNLPLVLNPFFENDNKDTETDQPLIAAVGAASSSSSTATDTRQPNKCRRCRVRRASESVLDNLKYSSSSDARDSLDSCTRTPSGGGGVLKQNFKKSTTSSAGGPGNRKVLLREPILKALQTCLHPHSNVRRKLLATATNTGNANNDGPLATKGMSDFRDLIDECRNLLTEEVDFSGRLNQLSLSNRNSKNFTTMQTLQIQNNKLRNNRRQILNNNDDSLATSSPTSPSTSATSSSTLKMGVAGGCDNRFADEQNLRLLVLPPLSPLMGNSSINSTSLQQRNGSSNTSSPEHSSTNHNRSSSTCSQQAGNSAAASCDDVNIEELASYFDTFVHIPKKMSSMAEMMYI